MNPASNESLLPEEWRDLTWLLRVVEEWLLYAEPTTVRELDRFLLSIGSAARSPEVLRRTSEVRRRLHRLRVQ